MGAIMLPNASVTRMDHGLATGFRGANLDYYRTSRFAAETIISGVRKRVRSGESLVGGVNQVALSILDDIAVGR